MGTVIDSSSTFLLHYELSTEDEVLDSTFETKPLEIKMGKGDIHPFVEKILLGRKEGEKVECQIDSSLAFGDIDEELKIVISSKKLPLAPSEIKVGSSFEAKDKNGKKRRFRVTALEGPRVTLDGNHPLAGLCLELRAEIVKIQTQ